MEKRETFYTVHAKVNWCSHCGKKYGVFLKKLKLELPYDPAILFLDTHTHTHTYTHTHTHTHTHIWKKMKTLIWKDKCTPMFIAALFTIAKTSKQLKCPSTDEWIKMKYYSAIKKEWKISICSNMDGLGGHYAKWNKS